MCPEPDKCICTVSVHAERTLKDKGMLKECTMQYKCVCSVSYVYRQAWHWQGYSGLIYLKNKIINLILICSVSAAFDVKIHCRVQRRREVSFYIAIGLVKGKGVFEILKSVIFPVGISGRCHWTTLSSLACRRCRCESWIFYNTL